MDAVVYGKVNGVEKKVDTVDSNIDSILAQLTNNDTVNVQRTFNTYFPPTAGKVCNLLGTSEVSDMQYTGYYSFEKNPTSYYVDSINSVSYSWPMAQTFDLTNGKFAVLTFWYNGTSWNIKVYLFDTTSGNNPTITSATVKSNAVSPALFGKLVINSSTDADIYVAEVEQTGTTYPLYAFRVNINGNTITSTTPTLISSQIPSNSLCGTMVDIEPIPGTKSALLVYLDSSASTNAKAVVGDFTSGSAALGTVVTAAAISCYSCRIKLSNYTGKHILVVSQSTASNYYLFGYTLTISGNSVSASGSTQLHTSAASAVQVLHPILKVTGDKYVITYQVSNYEYFMQFKHNGTSFTTFPTAYYSLTNGNSYKYFDLNEYYGIQLIATPTANEYYFIAYTTYSSNYLVTKSVKFNADDTITQTDAGYNMLYGGGSGYWYEGFCYLGNNEWFQTYASLCDFVINRYNSYQSFSQSYSISGKGYHPWSTNRVAHRNTVFTNTVNGTQYIYIVIWTNNTNPMYLLTLNRTKFLTSAYTYGRAGVYLGNGVIAFKGLVTGLSGLTPASKYYYDSSLGTLTTNSASGANPYIGFSISSTELVIKDYLG